MSASIFISHSEDQVDFVSDLIDLFDGSLELNRADIGFSALARSGGDMGALWGNLVKADAVVVIVAGGASEDALVPFELGAAWGLGKPILRVVREATLLESAPFNVLSGSSLELIDRASLIELVSTLADTLNVQWDVSDQARHALTRLVPDEEELAEQQSEPTAESMPPPASSGDTQRLYPLSEPPPPLEAEPAAPGTEIPTTPAMVTSEEYPDSSARTQTGMPAPSAAPQQSIEAALLQPVPAQSEAPAADAAPVPGAAPIVVDAAPTDAPSEDAPSEPAQAVEEQAQEPEAAVDPATLQTAVDRPSPVAPSNGASAAEGHTNGVPSRATSLEAGRLFSDCIFNVDEDESVLAELEGSFGDFVDALGGRWEELRKLKDMEVWLGAVDNLLDSLAAEHGHVKSWYEVGFQVATMLNLAGQTLGDADAAARNDLEAAWGDSLIAFRSSATQVLSADSVNEVQRMLENLFGPEADKDYTYIARSVQQLRELAQTADGTTHS